MLRLPRPFTLSILFCFSSVFCFSQDTLTKKSIADTSASSSPIENGLRSFVQDSTKVSIADSIKAEVKKPAVSKPLSLRSVVIPTAMIAYGTLALSNKDLKKLNLTMRKEIWEDRGSDKKLKLDEFSLIAPAVAVYGLNMAGIKGKNNLVDRTMIYGMSNLIGSGIVATAKRAFNQFRPDSTNRLSFPSGHTAKAFISAEFLRQEYKHLSPWYGVAGYAVAVGTGYLRMYNNKHWLNDVVAGAGVGILSTRLSYWLYPKLKNSFLNGKNKKNSTAIMPTYQNGAVGVGMIHSF